MTLPSVITHQDKLLTIDTNKEFWVKDALVPGVDVCPVFLDAQNGIWGLRVKFAPGVVLPNHFHTGCVHLYTMSGSWHYAQHPDQPQTAGCYLYEPGGSVHQFMTPASNTEPTDTFMVVFGANINFDQDGNFLNIMDAGWIEETVHKAAQAQGIPPLNYIRSLGPRYSVT
ncbi:2,4'-dihydroxyacetophenone dioxygenase [Burkholderia stabilis]|uniref:2,4'-dihydroxyacetophenone dioxygenase n=1 Tax=Burkholderia stabilis TaxID=95485 RepID=A0A4V1PQK5_9BURK|nr:2,4'-dihydroxyacetophenone dioxygenase family protein [Burkholderia stabilis]RXV64414.1 2,4'-dihydroxyacetophenone dioxygenase [Burkholderia stabilis]